MLLNVSGSIKEGSTQLAAFDAALNATGVADRNLIRLSSVIPAGSKVKVLAGPIQDVPGQWGDRLYVVYAQQRTSTHNEEAWAGIGWVQDEKDGKGLFVEHDGMSKKQVEQDITNSLKDLMKTRGVDFGKIKMKIVGGTCKVKPICALVVAVYQASDWDNVGTYEKV
ncbi:pyruvoyl-dependent arginine decarboxylase [Candidatus Saccharibacteria bacterium]|nr:pyruvoyl-dependent arginine decarboxylase [Candidatus Saccharibacteria bacterium]